MRALWIGGDIEPWRGSHHSLRESPPNLTHGRFASESRFNYTPGQNVFRSASGTIKAVLPKKMKKLGQSAKPYHIEEGKDLHRFAPAPYSSRK
jgi:hypothetical protein